MKTEVYSWRVSAELKSGLKEAARAKKLSMSEALEVAATEWIDRQKEPDDDAEQARLRAVLAQCIGVSASGRRNRSTQVSQDMKEKLSKKYATRRTG